MNQKISVTYRSIGGLLEDIQTGIIPNDYLMSSNSRLIAWCAKGGEVPVLQSWGSRINTKTVKDSINEANKEKRLVYVFDGNEEISAFRIAKKLFPNIPKLNTNGQGFCESLNMYLLSQGEVRG